MRHRKAGRHLNRNAAHRRSLFRNLARALFTHERLITTAKKANAAVVAAEGKDDAEVKKARSLALHYRRQAMSLLGPTHGTGIYDKEDRQQTDPANTTKKTSNDTVL